MDIRTYIKTQRDQGFKWSQIARSLDITKERAHDLAEGKVKATVQEEEKANG